MMALQPVYSVGSPHQVGDAASPSPRLPVHQLLERLAPAGDGGGRRGGRAIPAAGTEHAGGRGSHPGPQQPGAPAPPDRRVQERALVTFADDGTIGPHALRMLPSPPP